MTVNVATPVGLVVADTVVSVLLVLDERAMLTVLPDTGLPAPFLSVTVMVEVLNPSAATVAGEATTVDSVVLIAWTVRFALAELAVSPLVVVTVPVRLDLVPVLVEVTSAVMLQLPLAGMVPPLKLRDLPPADALSVPPQLLLVVSGEAIFSPLGKLSLKAAPVSATLLGLVSVMVLVLVPFTPMVAGLKLVLTVGAAFAKTTVLVLVQVLFVIVTVTVWATVLVAVRLIGESSFRFCVYVWVPLLNSADPVMVRVVL